AVSAICPGTKSDRVRLDVLCRVFGHTPGRAVALLPGKIDRGPLHAPKTLGNPWVFTLWQVIMLTLRVGARSSPEDRAIVVGCGCCRASGARTDARLLGGACPRRGGADRHLEMCPDT